ncbi:hypothetical protein KIW84_025084 [Lathyrus oleraceus]|uniref:AT-hook motif nuclear-localized protein n=1 Tax=Pisum sativum TaxID=3888 RepID=A0A9D5BA69_PEA|nr:hypothetical protein KIW84_025084 [Pisum sativum]
MDSREPPQPPHHPHGHHFQPPSNVVLMGPNPFTNTAPTTMMAPATARFPLFNVNANPANPANPPPHSEPFTTTTTITTVNTTTNTTTTVPPTLVPCVAGTTVPPTLVPCVAGSSESFKKKRGRPRKYFPDDSTALGLGSGSGSGSGSGQALAMTSPDSSTAKKSKRGRGRPRGSVKKKLGDDGSVFRPHVIMVNHGEDIFKKVMAFSQERAGSDTEMCVVSAEGLIGTVALHQAGSIVVFEGQFEIISLSAQLVESDDGSGLKRMSNLKISVGGPDSRLLGGVVADKLVAASTVKVIMGCFNLDGKKTSSNNQKSGPSSTPPSHFAASGTPTSPTSQGPSSESSGDHENSPFTQGPGVYNNASQVDQNMMMFHHPQVWARQTQQISNKNNWDRF